MNSETREELIQALSAIEKGATLSNVIDPLAWVGSMLYMLADEAENEQEALETLKKIATAIKTAI